MSIRACQGVVAFTSCAIRESNMTPILVTGGAGYIGSHTCKALAAAGCLPIAYDNLARGHRWAVKWGPLEEGDIADRKRLVSVIRKYQPTAVLHFAAYAYVGESMAAPQMYYRNNVVGSLTLLEAMVECGVSAMVFSSSCATYGRPHTIPIPEDEPQQPINPYGMSKLAVERMCIDFATAYGLNVAILRYFNAAGADPDGETGEHHEPETHLIPLALQAALGVRPSITVYGDDYDTPDGTCVRDFIHVTDLADAHVLALRAALEGKRALALNLGAGRGFSVYEVIETVRRVTGVNVPIDVGPRRPGDPPVLIADSRKANHILGWQPRYPELTQIVETAWRWMRHSPFLRRS